MAANKLSLESADKIKAAIMQQQANDIYKIYLKWSYEVGDMANKYAMKKTKSAPLTARYYRELERMIKRTANEVSKEIEGLITKNMYQMSIGLVENQLFWLESMGFPSSGLTMMFANVPKEAVQALLTGTVYKSGWSLSKRIWTDNQNTLKEIYKVMAGGLAQNKGIYEIAKDLEKYVSPSAAKSWNLRAKDGKYIYKRKIDYNAQRLARTLVQHTYQQTLLETTKDNPFVKKYIWLSNGSRVCPICAARNGTEYYAKDLPLDHPNGMCVIQPVIDGNMSARVANWVKNPHGTYPTIDKFAEKYGYKYIAPVKQAVQNKATQTVINKTAQAASKINNPVVNKTVQDVLLQAGHKLKDPMYKYLDLKDIKSSYDIEMMFGKFGNSLQDWKKKMPKEILDIIKDLKKKEGLTWEKWYNKYIYDRGLKKPPKTPKKPKVPKTQQAASGGNINAENILQYGPDGKPIKEVEGALPRVHYMENYDKIYDRTKFNYQDYLDEYYRQIKSGEEIDLEDKAYKWLNNLPQSERDGVYTYSGGAYENMNRYLRGQEPYQMYPDATEQAQKALLRNKTDKEYIMRRETSYDLMRDYGIDVTPQNKDKIIGAIVRDRAFHSATPYDGKFPEQSIKYIIKVPKGTSGGYIKNISQFRSEKEFLLPQNVRMVIHDVEFNQYGRPVRYYVEIIDTGIVDAPQSKGLAGNLNKFGKLK